MPTTALADSGIARALRRGISVLSYVVPALLAVHAVLFWGRGIVAQETTTLVLNYLADRPALELVTDPRLSDWGQYQARELSYVFDFIDARTFAWLLDHGVLLFVPLSGVLGLVAVAVVYLRGATRVLGLDGVTARLLLALFLGCIVTQASTAVLYRSAKIALSVFLLLFFFQAWWLLDGRDRPRTRAWPRFALLFASGVAMALCDRQGFFYLALATVCLVCLPPRMGVASSRGRRVIATVGLALLGSYAYDRALGPALIHAIHGYWPDFSYQSLDWSALAPVTFAHAGEMLLGELRFFLGNLPLLVTLAACVALHFASRRARPEGERGVPTVLAQTVLLLLASVVLLALMILRHEPVYTIPDHWYRYYALAIAATFLLACSVFARTLAARHDGRATLAAHVIVLAMVANDVRLWPAQRAEMLASAWLGLQHSISAMYERYEACRDAPPAGAPEPWLRARPEGGVVELPVGDDSFVEDVRAAYATLRHRSPWADAGGTCWGNLHAFLTGDGSPLERPELFPDVLDGFRRVGIRRVRLRAERCATPEAAQARIAALRGATDAVRATTETPQGPEFELREAEPARAPSHALIGLDPGALTIEVSHLPGRALNLIDGSARTRWETVANGPSWLRVELDRARDIARLRLVLGRNSYGDYPLELAVETEDADGTRKLRRRAVLPLLVQSLLGDPLRGTIDLDLEPNRTTALALRHPRPRKWAVNELELFERAAEQPRALGR